MSLSRDMFALPVIDQTDDFHVLVIYSIACDQAYYSFFFFFQIIIAFVEENEMGWHSRLVYVHEVRLI